MNRFLKLGLLALSSLSLLACANKESAPSEMDKKVQAEPASTERGELAMRGANVFVNAPGLTIEQRDQLLQIHSQTYEQVAQLRDELTKTKSLLFKSLVDPKTPQKDIKTLKGKVIALDKQRLDVMLKAFDQVQKVVGKNAVDETVLKPFMEMDHVRF